MGKVTRKTPNNFGKLEEKIKELEGVTSKVGWFETAKYPNGTPVAYAAMLNELGHGKTPPRPFMRPTFDMESPKWKQIMKEGAAAILRGEMTAQQVFEQLAIVAEGDIEKSIHAVFNPPLSPVTIELRAMKKRNPDLVVTGKTVGMAAQKVAQPGYKAPTGVNTKPLEDTGLMVATLSHITETS